jgi:hypothetical protein
LLTLLNCSRLPATLLRCVILTLALTIVAYRSPAFEGPLSGPPPLPTDQPAAGPQPRDPPSTAQSTAKSSAQVAFSRGLAIFDDATAFAQAHPDQRQEVSRRYRAAASSFLEAWKAGVSSSEVFTNAANSYYFAGDMGEAVLFYRRALSVDPANPKAKKALAHIRSTSPVGKPKGGSVESLVRSLFFWHDGLSFGLRRLAFSGTFTLAFALLVVGLWRRRPFVLLGWTSLVVSCVLLGSLLTSALGSSVRADAVVLVEVDGRLGYGISYTPSYTMPFPPGTEVTILETHAPGRDSPEARGASLEPWVRVGLLDGSKSSWIPSGTVERVVP